MRYNENYKGNSRRRNDSSKDYTKTYNKVSQPLSVYYQDPKELYLPEGKAYSYAVDFKDIPPHQLRKVLNGAKEAKAYSDAGDFENARKTLFVMVAMSAYNAGRDKKSKGLQYLYYFIRSVINEKSIESKKDIDAFDELFTSIIAYHKGMCKKK